MLILGIKELRGKLVIQTVGLNFNNVSVMLLGADRIHDSWKAGRSAIKTQTQFILTFRLMDKINANNLTSLFVTGECEDHGTVPFFRELDATVMRAIASLLSGLPLQPEGMETDIVEAKSQLFLK